MKANSPLQLARKQKRLKYFQEQFMRPEYNKEVLGDIKELLKAYSLSLSKLAKSKGNDEIATADAETSAIERKLSEVFKQSMLKTSPLSKGLKTSLA